MLFCVVALCLSVLVVLIVDVHCVGLVVFVLFDNRVSVCGLRWSF